jgi:hypothetical protein
MTTGWDSLEVPTSPSAANAAHDPVAEFGGPAAVATDAPFRDSHVEADEVDGAFETPYDDAEHEAPQAKSKAPLYIGLTVLACVTVGGLFLMLQPLVTALTGGAGSASSTPKSSALAVAAVKAPVADSAGVATNIPVPVPSTVAASASPVASDAPTPASSSAAAPSTGATAAGTPVAVEAPKQERLDAGTATAVAAVLANAKTVEATSSKAGTGAQSSAVAPSAATPSATAPVAVTPPVQSAHAQPRHRASASTNVRSTKADTGKGDKSAAKSRAMNAGDPSAGEGPRRTEQLMGYSLLAINPRVGDFQQAWVRDSAGRLQIVSSGDRLGSVQVLRIDGAKGEVQTAAGVIR